MAKRETIILKELTASTGKLEAPQTGDTYFFPRPIEDDLPLVEQADHSSTPAAGFGYVWVRSDAPNVVMFTDDAGTDWVVNGLEVISLALSANGVDLDAVTDIDDYTFPFDFELVEVATSTITAPTGSTLITDINLTGTGTILSTKISQDVGELNSYTAATPPVLSTTTFSKGDQLTFDRDQVGSTVAGQGQKLFLIGRRT